MRHVAVTCLLVVIGCGDGGAPAPKDPVSKEARVEDGVDGRDQYALLDDILRAQADPGDVRGPALARVRSSWTGQRYLWEARVVPPLCRSARACVVAPFDRARLPERAQQGWLPRLELSEDGHARLERLCREESPCVVLFEGRLSDLELSMDQPTSVGFTDVRVVGARSARPDESWLRRPDRG